MLDGHYAGALWHDLGFGREGQVGSCGEGDDRSDGGSVGIFVVAEWAFIEDAVELLEVCDGCVFEVDFGLLNTFGEF